MVLRAVKHGKNDKDSDAVVTHHCDECGRHGQCSIAQCNEKTVTSHAFAAALQEVTEHLCARATCKAIKPSVFSANLPDAESPTAARDKAKLSTRVFVVFQITNVDRCGVLSQHGKWPEAEDLPTYSSRIGFCELAKQTLLPLSYSCRMVSAPIDPRYCLFQTVAALYHHSVAAVQCYSAAKLHHCYGLITKISTRFPCLDSCSKQALSPLENRCRVVQ